MLWYTLVLESRQRFARNIVEKRRQRKQDTEPSTEYEPKESIIWRGEKKGDVVFDYAQTAG